MKRDRGTGCYYAKKATGIYWIKFHCDGQAHFESTGKRGREGAKAARELLKARLLEVSAGAYIDGSDRLRIGDLVDLLKGDYKRRERRSLRRVNSACVHLLEHFALLAVRRIPAKVPVYVETRRGEKAANATIAYEIACLRRAFTLAARARLIPYRPEIESVTVSNARGGFVEEGTFARLVAALPEHLRNPARFLFATAWRKREVTGLRWSNVDFDAGEVRLGGSETKTGTPRVFPLHGDVREILEAQRVATTAWDREQSTLTPWVFWRPSGGQAKPLVDFRESWTTACKSAGVPWLLIHDLRRSRARIWSNAGVPDRVGMALGGWKTRSMYDRYSIVSKDDMTAAIDRAASPKANEA